MLRSLACAIALVVAATPAAAFDSAGEPVVTVDIDAPATITVASNAVPLTLVVNGVDDGISFVVERGGDVLVPLADIRHAHIALPSSLIPARASGGTFVGLNALAPGVRYTVDEEGLVLALAVDPKLLPQTNVALVTPNAIPSADPVTSGFVNYTISASTGGGLPSAANAFLDTGVGSGRGVFDLTVATDSTFSTEGRTFRRGLTSYTIETQSKLSRATIGDAVADGGPLGSQVTIGGISAERAFDLQPRFLRLPSAGIAGTVLEPTTADVYVNGTFVRSVTLAPGPYDLSALNVQNGANATTVVLHGASGTTTTVNQSLYLDADLLRRGVSDYDYALGFVRPNPFGDDDVYGPLALLARYRVGVTNDVSVGARFEGDRALASFGPRVDVGLPAGALSFFAASSDAAGTTGAAIAGAYDYSGRGVSLDVSATRRSRGYATLDLAPRDDRRVSEVDERLTAPIGRRTTVSLSNENVIDRDEGAQRIFEASVLTNVTRKTSLNLYAEKIASSQPANQLSFVPSEPTTIGPVALTQNEPQSAWTFGGTLFVQLGGNVDAIATTQTGGGRTSNGVVLQRAAPAGPGFGYRLETDTGNGSATTFAQAIDQTRVGDLNASVTTGDGTTAQASFSGGIGIFRQGAVFSRPLDASYALVHVAGLDDAPVLVNDVFAGRTDGRGLLVTPNVAAYFPNAIAIGDLQAIADVRELPAAADVIPKNRTAAIADLAVERVRIFRGTIAIGKFGGDAIVPRYGIVDLASGRATFRSDLGSGGAFYFENLPPGTYEATVEYGGGACTFAIAVPVARTLETDLGALTCAAP